MTDVPRAMNSLTVRLLRAKAAELETRLVNAEAPSELDYLAADVALIAGLLADEIDRHVEIRQSARAPGHNRIAGQGLGEHH